MNFDTVEAGSHPPRLSTNRISWSVASLLNPFTSFIVQNTPGSCQFIAEALERGQISADYKEPTMPWGMVTVNAAVLFRADTKF